MKRLIAMCLLLLFTNSSMAHRDGWGGHGGGGWRGGFGGYYGGGGGFYGSRGYSGFGFYYGGPGFGWPYYPGFYPPPFYGYYPPTVMTTPSSPPVYIEKNATDATSPRRESIPGVWHFCEATHGYYPKVQDCPSGWTEISQVPPQQEAGYWYRCPHPEGYYPYVRQCPEAWIKSDPQDNSSTPAD